MKKKVQKVKYHNSKAKSRNP